MNEYAALVLLHTFRSPASTTMTGVFGLGVAVVDELLDRCG